MTSPRVTSGRLSAPATAVLCFAAALLGAGLGWRSTARRPDLMDTARAPGQTAVLADDRPSLVARSPATVCSPWGGRWETATALASTPARTRVLSSLLEELARTEPERALTLARAQGDWRLRGLLRDAALRGWASVAPEAAGDWALAARPEDRRAIIGAVLQGAARDPDSAVRLALRLCASDPAPAGDYGHSAIAALVDAGAFAQAARFATQAGVEKHPFLVKSAYFEWARHQPAAALAASGRIEDPVLAARAKSQVISGWAWADAAGLADHALALPSGAERSQALAEALPLWLERDPATAAIWIQQHENGPDFDAGIAALANQQSFLTRRPAAALDLAADIADPAKRTETMRSVFQQWAARDPRSARSYLETTANAAALSAFEEPAPPPRP